MVEVFITKFEGLRQSPQTDMVGEENRFLQVVLWANVCAHTHIYKNRWIKENIILKSEVSVEHTPIFLPLGCLRQGF